MKTSCDEDDCNYLEIGMKKKLAATKSITIEYEMVSIYSEVSLGPFHMGT